MILVNYPIGDETCMYCARGIDHDHISDETRNALLNAQQAGWHTRQEGALPKTVGSSSDIARHG